MPFGIGRGRREAPGDWRRVGGSGLAVNLMTRGGAPAGVIAAAEARLEVSLSPSLAAFVGQADTAEGWVSAAGSRCGPSRSWPSSTTAPGWRTSHRRSSPSPPTAAVRATSFDRDTGHFLSSSMIGLGYIDATPLGGSFDDMLAWIAARFSAPSEQPAPDTTRFGLVIHEITPILFGGDPVDPRNKVCVPLADYAAVVGWWNERGRYIANPTSGWPMMTASADGGRSVGGDARSRRIGD